LDRNLFLGNKRGSLPYRDQTTTIAWNRGEDDACQRSIQSAVDFLHVRGGDVDFFDITKDEGGQQARAMILEIVCQHCVAYNRVISIFFNGRTN
jgi:hypothetical protein